MKPRKNNELRGNHCAAMICDMRDASWVKSRIGARILLRAYHGRLLTRDRRLARELASDSAVTDRLLDQALASICAEKGLLPEEYHAILRATLAT